MSDFQDLYNDLREYLINLGFTFELNQVFADFFLGEYELICVVLRDETIWYRTYPDNVAKLNKIYYATKDDFNHIKKLAVRLVKMYKHKQVSLAKKNMEKDFV